MAKVRITVDTRERALMSELNRIMSDVSPVVECHSEMLDVGDVHMHLEDDCGTPQLVVLVERKTLADLASSIRDGRYREQKERAVATGVSNIMYIIEATPGSLNLGYGTMSDVNGMPAARLQGCIASMILSNKISVTVTRSVEETAGFLVRLGSMLTKRAMADTKVVMDASARYEQSACSASSVRTRKRDNVDPRLCYLQQLCQVPGISHGIATSIASAYPTMRALISSLEVLPDNHAREAQLAKVPMVGRKLSARLCEFMFS